MKDLRKSRDVTDEVIWNNIIENWKEFEIVQRKIKYLLSEFGTSLRCNRFDIGNSIEFLLCNFFIECGFDIVPLHNKTRYDIRIENRSFSIKYSSSGNIKLHNSNNHTNTDMKFNDLILLTPDKLYIITHNSIGFR